MGTGRDIVITGLGAVSALGHGREALWEGIAEGRDGLDVVRRFSTDELSVHLGGMVPGHDDEEENSGLCAWLGIEAAREAWTSAGLDGAGIAPERIAMVVGTSMGDEKFQYHGLTEKVAAELGVRGPLVTVSTACCSSTTALGLALELLDGAADVVLAGGADALSIWVFAGFHAMGVLSKQKCAPFSTPVGTTLGEGAGFAVLESGEHAGKRGGRPLVHVHGYGLSADAFHETAPDPSGRGMARCIASALRDAGLEPTDIDYISAHGTGTASNDPSEWQSVLKAFGDHARSLPVSSQKAALGHAQGAAGVLELIATIECMNRRLVPQTLHYKGPRPRSPVDPVASDTPRRHDYDHALSLSEVRFLFNQGPVVPEPSTLVLLAVGGVFALIGLRRRRSGRKIANGT